MNEAKQLTLPEEMLLIMLKDETGTVAFGVNDQHTLAGAILAELLLSGRISISEDKKKLVDLVDDTPFGDEVLDDALARVATAKRRAAPKNWVMRFANLKKLRHRVAAQLCARGILKHDEDKILLLFNRKIYPEIDPRPERKLIARIERAIFTDSGSVEARTAILISLAKSSDCLRLMFEKRRLKLRKARIEKIVNGDLMGKATKDAIDAMNAAVFIACIVPAVVVSSS